MPTHTHVLFNIQLMNVKQVPDQPRTTLPHTHILSVKSTRINII